MIYLGADHGGYELKEKIKEHLKAQGQEFEDLGTFSKASVDYPKYAFPEVLDKVRGLRTANQEQSNRVIE